MSKQIRERVLGSGADFYSGDVIEDPRLFARLEVSRDCEAELAVLLTSAARRGVLRLDRILPFLTPSPETPATPLTSDTG
jgi:hypothetical protein